MQFHEVCDVMWNDGHTVGHQASRLCECFKKWPSYARCQTMFWQNDPWQSYRYRFVKPCTALHFLRGNAPYCLVEKHDAKCNTRNFGHPQCETMLAMLPIKLRGCELVFKSGHQTPDARQCFGNLPLHYCLASCSIALHFLRWSSYNCLGPSRNFCKWEGQYWGTTVIWNIALGLEWSKCKLVSCLIQCLTKTALINFSFIVHLFNLLKASHHLIDECKNPLNQTEARKPHKKPQISTSCSQKVCEVINQSFRSFFCMHGPEKQNNLKIIVGPIFRFFSENKTAVTEILQFVVVTFLNARHWTSKGWRTAHKLVHIVGKFTESLEKHSHYGHY